MVHNPAKNREKSYPKLRLGRNKTLHKARRNKKKTKKLEGKNLHNISGGGGERSENQRFLVLTMRIWESKKEIRW